jgi:hypothetical protein
VKTNDEDSLRKILNNNIHYFSNELKKVEDLMLNEEESEENKKSSVSSGISEYSKSDVSNWNLEYSILIHSNDKLTKMKSKSSSSKSFTENDVRKLRNTMNQPEVCILDEIENESVTSESLRSKGV